MKKIILLFFLLVPLTVFSQSDTNPELKSYYGKNLNERASFGEMFDNAAQNMPKLDENNYKRIGYLILIDNEIEFNRYSFFKIINFKKEFDFNFAQFCDSTIESFSKEIKNIELVRIPRKESEMYNDLKNTSWNGSPHYPKKSSAYQLLNKIKKEYKIDILLVLKEERTSDYISGKKIMLEPKGLYNSNINYVHAHFKVGLINIETGKPIAWYHQGSADYSPTEFKMPLEQYTPNEITKIIDAIKKRISNNIEQSLITIGLME